jgi:hypothetical protein
LTDILRENSDDLVNDVVAEVHQARLEHYEAEGLRALRERVQALLDLTLECLDSCRAEPINDWAVRVARERYSAGYDLLELQTAINAVEEALWKRILSNTGPEDLAHALGLVNAILGMSKDTLARTYVSLATEREAPQVDFSKLLRTGSAAVK